MAQNAFTTEPRDARLSFGIAGLIDKLRAPESLHRLVMLAKPATASVGDFALKSMLDAYLMAAIIRSDYAAVYGTLGTLFGKDVTSVPAESDAPREVTSVTPGDRRFAKAPGRAS